MDKAIEHLQADTLLTVYHGTDYETAYDMLQNGIDAKAEHYRKYPHWTGQGDKKLRVGLFITTDLTVAKNFGRVVLEFKVRGKDLYPTNANTVDKIRLADSKVKSYYPNSFRPSVSFGLLSGGTESQALFRGFISPKEINKKLYVYDTKWNDMTSEQYLEQYKTEAKDIHKKVVEPQEKISLDEFYKRVVKEEGGSVADVKKSVEFYFDRITSEQEKLAKFIEIFTPYALPTALKRLGRMAIQEFNVEKGFKAKVKAKYSILSEVAVKEFKGTYYHQTSTHAADAILKNGFSIFEGGNQRFTEGVYLLDHDQGHFGEATLSVKVEGNFLDLHADDRGKDWQRLKEEYWDTNYTKFTKKLQTAYPTAQGIMLPTMLVVWDLKAIKEINRR